MHAPCDRGDGSPEWWQDSDKVLTKHLGQDQLVILADANAHVGEHPCDAIGGHEPEATNESGFLFTRLLTKRKLFAPNTFERFGGSERDVKTWQGRGTLSYRIDYVALPIAWMQHTTYAATVHDIDIALSRVDHSTTVAEVSLSRHAPITRKGNRMPKIDINLLHDENRLSTFVQELASIPKPGWEVDIDTHLGAVNDYVRRAMGRNFATKGLVIKRGWISAEAQELMQERAHRHKAIAALRREARMNAVYMVFRVWKGQVDMDTIIGYHARARAQLHTIVAMHFHYVYTDTCPMLRWKLKQDKAAALDEKMGVARTAAANNNTKKLYTILKQLRSYTPKPPKGIQLKSGDMAKSHDQVQPRWREHFRDLL